eukprot:3355907-Amphidinium_carterae.1
MTVGSSGYRLAMQTSQRAQPFTRHSPAELVLAKLKELQQSRGGYSLGEPPISPNPQKMA